MNRIRLVQSFFRKRGPAPVSLVHFVTARCNARCAHCFVDRRLGMYQGEELALDEIERLAESLAGRVYHVSLGGGEPTLRDDLARIALAYGQRARVRTMLIVSNGSRPDALCEVAERMLADCPRTDLIVSLSVDEVGDAHDALRGMPGLFDALMGSYHALAPLKARGLSLNANFTLSNRNQARALEVVDKAMKLMPEASFSLTAVRGDTAEPDASEIDPGVYGAVADLLARRVATGHQPAEYDNFVFGRRLLNARKHLLREHILRVLRGEPAIGECYAGQLSGVLMANGSVYPCEMLDRCMGQVRDFGFDFSKLWRSPAAQAVRGSIDVKQCACTYECAWGVNLMFGLRHMPRLLAAFVREGRHQA